jgi:thiamine-phosphate pyrophosphorylase
VRSQVVEDRRARLARSSLYVCTGLRPDLASWSETVLGAGVDLLQLRHKGLEAAEELTHLRVLREACARHGALCAVNDRADLAAVLGADVLHLGQGDLTPEQARRIVGPDVLIGRSSHTVAQARDAVQDPDVDYFCVGPLWETPTKPGRAAVGPALLADVASMADVAKPWFAIGGIDRHVLPEVLAAGARRAVVVRAVTEAQDPAAAVRELRALLCGT